MGLQGRCSQITKQKECVSYNVKLPQINHTFQHIQTECTGIFYKIFMPDKKNVFFMCSFNQYFLSL